MSCGSVQNVANWNWKIVITARTVERICEVKTMRLIDADALFETLVTGDIRETHQFCYPCKKVLEAIDAQPTVDPQQAIRDAYKHGKSKGIKRGLAMARRKHEE